MEGEVPKAPRVRAFLAKVANDVAASGAAKAILIVLGLLLASVVSWFYGTSRPGWMHELVQTSAVSGGMNENTPWKWGNISLEPVESHSNRMRFSNHPDGDVYVEFTYDAMVMDDDDPGEREFVVYCGTHQVKTGSGVMGFHRNYQVFSLFDIEGDPRLVVWMRGDLMAKDAEGHVANRL